MIRMVVLISCALGFVAMTARTTEARNTPCSQSKGGVKACQGDKYLCNDGSISASKTKCSRS